MRLNTEQLDKLSGLSMDLAKGLFLSAFALPALTKVPAFEPLRAVASGIFFVLIALKLIDLKEVYR